MFKQVLSLALLSMVVLSTTACKKRKTCDETVKKCVHVTQHTVGNGTDTTVEWSESEADLK